MERLFAPGAVYRLLAYTSVIYIYVHAAIPIYIYIRSYNCSIMNAMIVLATSCGSFLWQVA